MKIPRRKLHHKHWYCSFSSTTSRPLVKNVAELPGRIYPVYKETKNNDLLSLRWPSPPKNILLIKKSHSRIATDSLTEFARHVHASYPETRFILEPPTATELNDVLPFPIYSLPADRDAAYQPLHRKVDMTTTFGGDGTILHASSLFATTSSVPPILSFSLGTLGFLGEWKIQEYKRAFRELYMSGAGIGDRDIVLGENAMTARPFDENAVVEESGLTGWSSIRGKSLGTNRGARVLLRSRLKVAVFSGNGERISGNDSSASAEGDVYAMNEVIIHRGKDPHLAIVEVFVGGRFLTEAVSDGMIISTPTGSTAYSLSSGGSIIHPLVSSLLLTPICPRSLSFRPLVLPANTPITLRLSEKNRGREVEVSIDGVRRSQGVGVGMEVRVWGEEIKTASGEWTGGVPCVMRGGLGAEANGDDGWVGGLNGLLKFNYPFGEEG